MYLYSVPVGVAEKVKAYPYNSSAIVVNWEAVPNTRESIKGVLLGYRVGEAIFLRFSIACMCSIL